MNRIHQIDIAIVPPLAAIASASGQDTEEGVGATQREDLAATLLECSPLAEQGDAVGQSMTEII